MDYPADDVVKNIRHFLSVIKKATGNQRAPDGKRPKDDTKPGKDS
jgi:large subunit ribosomal protein L1